MKQIAAGLIALSLVFNARAGFYSTPALPNINTNNVVVVTSAPYNAVGDGVTTNTTAIQAAINFAATGGTTNGAAGGTVEIPPGIYLCGPINLANSVNLQVDAGAILRMLPYGMYPGGTNTGTTFISASSKHDVEISGPGAIDGQGAAWWPFSSSPTASRPIMIGPSSCNRLLIQNITLSNSPMFHIAVGSGVNTTVQGVTIYAPGTSPNTDACDVSGTLTLVQNCNISEGDDDFTCGGGTSGVLLTNNTYGTGHGVSIGSYTDSGGVSNIMVVNCSFTGTDNGIRIKSERGRGGLVQNLQYYNLSMTNVGWPLLVYGYYELGLGQITGVNPVYAANEILTNLTAFNSLDPIFRNITFSNINATMPSGRPPLVVWGLPEALASNIVFRSVNITSSSTLVPGVYNATNIQFIDCNFTQPAGKKDLQVFNAGVIFSNTPGGAAAANLWLLDGLTTNGYGSSLQFYNALGTLANTNAFATGPLRLSASTLTVSNNLNLSPQTVVNLALGTNTTQLAVAGNLNLGGTNNIFADSGFSNGTYVVMAYTGTLSGSAPAIGLVPTNFNYSYSFDTSTANQVKLMVTLEPPTNLVASATNLQIGLNWASVIGANTFSLKRGTTAGIYPTIIAGLTGTNYTDANVTNAVKYYYVVSASGAGGESTNSLPANSTPLPSNQPSNIVMQVVGNQLQLSWPQDHLGWRLQIQTNNLANGLGTNWVTVPNSTNVLGTNILISPSNNSVFLRLIYP